MPWSHTRSWENTGGNPRSGMNGNGWGGSSEPKLVQGPDGAIAVVFDGTNAEWFNAGATAGTYIARHDSRDTLTYGAADDVSDTNEYVFTTEDGAQTRFYDLSSATVLILQQGGFKSYQVPGAARIEVQSHDPAGRTEELHRSVTAGGVTTIESWQYKYVESGPNAGRLGHLALRRSTNNGTDWTIVRQVAYTYYDGSAAGEYSFGTRGDLRTAEVQDRFGAAINTWYYRYYKGGGTGGYAGGMRYVFEPEQYARLVAALPSGTTPLTASDIAVAPYASRAYQYDSQHRVTQEVVAERKSSQGVGDDRGTIGYTYATSSHPDGYNAWKTKTVETRPDGATNTVFTNYVGDVILRVSEDHSAGQPFSGDRLATFHAYDLKGRVEMTAHPSAFKPDADGKLYDESDADLLGGPDHDGNYVYLGDDFGQLDLTTYATDTTATATAAGDVAGLPAATYTRRGDYGGAPIQQSATQYYLKTVTPAGTGGVAQTVTPVASTSVYPDAVEGTPGAARTTDYAYTWFAGSAAVESVTVLQPVVSAGRNGPGGTARDTDVTYFDPYGNPTWTMDAGGTLGYAAWDLVTGAMVKAVTDVDATQTTTFAGKPTGWSTPAGGGLHLTTLVRVDGLGRATKVTDPNGNASYTVYKDALHEVRAYRGWNPATHATTGPTEVAREYRPAANAAAGQRALYYETLTTSAAPAYDAGTNEPTGAEAVAAGNIQSLSRTVTNDAGQVTDALDYFSLTGVTYAVETAFLGTASNDSATGNYHRTQYRYDAAGRAGVLVSPTGTITRTVFDGRGNAAAVYVGTNDAGATDLDPDGSGGSNNLVRVSETEYDESCGCPGSSGNGQPTKVTVFPGGGAAARVTEYHYDWRGRLVATKGGVQGGAETTADNAHPVAYADLNNLGQATASYLYDGDGVTVTRAAGVPVKPSASLLRAKTATSYDEQSRPYRVQRYSVDPATGTVSTAALTTDTFYDRRGLVVKAAAPGGLVSKAVYDGAGRVTTAYATDGGGDTGWSHAGTVDGDAVLEQTETAYDANGNVVLTAARQRFHDETATGPLGGPASTPAAKARVYYSAAYYDAADRLVASVDVGTNGGTAYTRPGSVPARSDAALVTSYGYYRYNGNNQWSVTDPRGIFTYTGQDLLGRTTQTVEIGECAFNPANRTTTYTYDGADHVLAMTAHLDGAGDDQTTRYVYGVTTAGGSGVNSNDLLKEVRYPEKATGAAGTASTDKEQYTYDAAGQAKTFTDRNGSVHAYGYDVLGRPTADAVTTLASGVDGAVRRLGTAYDTQGNAAVFTSYNAATGGSVVNQVQRAFDGFGQLTAEYQAVGGSVNTATTPKVQYAYTAMAGGANHSRPTSMTYPDGRVLRYEYASGLDATIGRVSTLADQTSGGGVGTHLADYGYLGLGTVVREARPETGTELTYAKRTGEADGDAGDRYTGLNRFGRVADQRWLTTATGAATDRFRYGYDRIGNPLYKQNDVLPGLSELYHANGAAVNHEYDGLGRLTDFRRGTLTDANSDGRPDTVTAGNLSSLPGSSRSWALDVLGNQTSTTTDGTTTARTHNDRNELTGVGSAALTFDANGNTRVDDGGQYLAYDAWNRLKYAEGGALGVGTTRTVAYFGYDALGRRTSSHATTYAPVVNGRSTVTTDARTLYYSAGWQVVEDRLTRSVGTVLDDYCDYTPVSADAASTAQSVWGLGYVDDLVLRDRDADANSATGGYGRSGSGREERLYAQRDANHNVTALVDVSGTVAQRFVYDPYGGSTVLTGGGGLASDGYDWLYRHQGGRLETATGLYHFRHRDYDPDTGRWIEADPAGYVDGANLYTSYLNRPNSLNDPLGLATGSRFPEWPTSQEVDDEYDKLERWWRGDYAPDRSRWVQKESFEYWNYYQNRLRKLLEAGAQPHRKRVPTGDTLSKMSPGASVCSTAMGLGLLSLSNPNYLHAGLDANGWNGPASNGYENSAYELSFSFQDAMAARYWNRFPRGLGEAARHLYWSTILTYRWGPEISRCVTDAHERGQESSPDSRRDSANNAAGRRIAEGLPPGLTPDDIAGIVERELLNGSGFTENPNNPSSPLPFNPTVPLQPAIGPFRPPLHPAVR